MAKKVYVGVNNVAKNVKSIYVGVNGVARRVTKIYVGDANGKARLCYQYAQPVVTYKWNRYALTINDSPSVVYKTCGNGSYGDIHFNQGTWYDNANYGPSEAFELDSNGKLFIFDSDIEQDMEDNAFTPSRVGDEQYFYVTAENTFYFFQATSKPSTSTTLGNLYYLTKGTGTATAVTSTDPNAYPQNGQSGKYWYTYVGTV